jgi:hypothetical protein
MVSTHTTPGAQQGHPGLIALDPWSGIAADGRLERQAIGTIWHRPAVNRAMGTAQDANRRDEDDG